MNWARRSPLRYPGGKAKIGKYVAKIINVNKLKGCTYIEPYAGGAGVALALLLNGYVSDIIINDIDRSIYAVWYSILYRTEEFCTKILNTQVTIDEWKRQKEIQNNKEEALIFDLGFSTFFLNRTNRSGIIKAGMIGGWNQDSDYKMDCRFNKAELIKRIQDVSVVKDRIRLLNLSAEELIIEEISRYEGRQAFIFFDPPYYENGHKLYTNFYIANDHEKLMALISKDVQVPWIITYDGNNFITNLYNQYRQKKYSLSYSASVKREGEEIMIYSHNIDNCLMEAL